ncbi:hypothetical protein LA52FAK_27880 [Desulforhopalus sp. 52FAK]
MASIFRIGFIDTFLIMESIMINKSFENLNGYWEKRDTPKTGFYIENQIDKKQKPYKITSEFISTEAN